MIVLIVILGLSLGIILNKFMACISMRLFNNPYSKTYMKLVVLLLTIASCFLLYLKYELTFNFWVFCCFACFLILVSVIDFKFQVIPNRLLALGFVIALVFRLYLMYSLDAYSYFLEGFYGFLVGGGIHLITSLVSRESMGGGDIKLMFVIGLLLGVEATLATIFFSFLFGGLISVILIISGIKDRKAAISFGPFIALAAFSVLTLYPII